VIEDVELRFLERYVDAPEHGPDIAKAVRVLQWRKAELMWADAGARHYQWSDWEDVPLVTGEKP
jgi:hypothetical protein